MAIDERTPHELRQRLDEVLGAEEAATLIAHPPPTGWGDVVTREYLDENRDQVVAFLQHVQDGYDTVYEDKEGWTAMATETLPDVDEASLGEAYDYYTEIGMYPQSGEPPVTEQSWE